MIVQVKNYYLRQVESGRMSSWRNISQEADEKRKRGASTGPLPKPTMKPKRRIDGQTTAMPPIGTSIEGIDDLTSAGQTIVFQQGSPSQTRLPAPTPQYQPEAQQLQQPSRGPQGPGLSFFNTDSQRPILQAANEQGQSTEPISNSVSRRSLISAQEAHLERYQGLRLKLKLPLKSNIGSTGPLPKRGESTGLPRPTMISRRRSGDRTSAILRPGSHKIGVSYTISEDLSGDREKQILCRFSERKRNSGEVRLRIGSSYGR